MTPKEIIQEAQRLYILGVPNQEIGKRTGKHHQTIRKWAEKYQWEKLKYALQEAAEKTINEEIQHKKRLLKQTRAIQAQYLQNLAKKKISTSEALNAMQFESKILGLEVQKIQATHSTDSISAEKILEVFQNGDSTT